MQKTTITGAVALNLLKEGQPLIDFNIIGDLVIETDQEWENEIVIENCTIENFSGSSTTFKKQIRLSKSVFKNCTFIFAYFFGGLTIDNCIFEKHLDFQAGGHNKAGNSISISNNEFCAFVNFFDCWYNGDVIIRQNKFHLGTNLLGKPLNKSVTFDFKPTIQDNFGVLDLNNEG